MKSKLILDVHDKPKTAALLILGLGGVALSIVTKNISFSISGMSLVAIIGILLNRVLPKERTVNKYDL